MFSVEFPSAINTRRSLSFPSFAWALALNDCNGPKPHDLVGNACCLTRVHHLRDVFVRLRRLFHHQLGGGHANRDAVVCQSGENVLVAQVIAGLVAAQRPSGPVAGAPEGLWRMCIQC